MTWKGRLRDSDLVEKQDRDKVFAIQGLIFIGFIMVAIKGWSTLFSLVGLLFTGIGLLNLRTLFRARSPLHFLVVAPVTLLLSYGIIAFVFPNSLAEYIVPKAWEWPVGQDSSVMALDGGKTAVALEGVPRVQIYDPGGRYLGGWFVHNYGGPLNLVEKEAGQGDLQEEETVLVHVSRGHEIIMYNLAGDVVWAKESPEHIRQSMSRPTPGAYPFSWYEWPLVSSSNAGFASMIGLVGTILLHLLGFIKH